MSLPVVREQSRGILVATWGNVCVSIVRDQLSANDVAAARRVYERAANEHKQGFVSMIIAGGDAGLPSEEARRAIPDLMKGLEARVAAMVGVLEATGFKAAALRTAMATMAMVSRTNYPRKILSSVEDAVSFIAPFVQPSVTHDQLRAAIDDIKRLAGTVLE